MSLASREKAPQVRSWAGVSLQEGEQGQPLWECARGQEPWERGVG